MNLQSLLKDTNKVKSLLKKHNKTLTKSQDKHFGHKFDSGFVKSLNWYRSQKTF